MAKKNAVDEIIIEIRSNLKDNKVIIGTERVLKSLKEEKVSKVLLSANCRDDVKNDLEHFKSISNFEIMNLKYESEELGVICKKPYTISMIGFLKE